MTPRLHQIFFVLSVAIVGLALVWGFVLVGSPTTGRARKFDDRRIEDFRTIYSEILNIVHGENRYKPEPPKSLLRPLPQTLEEVAQLARFTRIHLRDPETGRPYLYTVQDATHFELCATFSTERDEPIDILWNHPAGHHCFLFDALDLRGPVKDLHRAASSGP